MSRQIGTRRSLVETLESRTLMAADFGATALTDGVLSVTGTRGADVIVVQPNSDVTKLDVLLDGSLLGTFNLTGEGAVTSIAIDGKQGNDTITVDTAVLLNAALLGAQGNDTLT